jgi:minor extracellular serine protease Vpr
MNRRRIAAALVGSALLLGAVVPAPLMAAGPKQQRPTAPVPQRIKDLKLDTPVTATNGVRPTALAASLRSATGKQQVVIRLKVKPTALIKGSAKQKAQLTRVNAQQAGFISRAKGISASFKVLGRTQTALNAVMASVSAKALARLSRDAAVQSINPVVDYQQDLSETVPYIGGTALQGLGIKGAGTTVAVLDSGIDYTHADLGGPGTLQAYLNAFGTKLKDTKNQKINDAYKGAKLYPTAKVIGGWDFVGEAWPNGPLAQDPDPIPCGPTIKEVCDGTHGTHVADIIAGKLGVAPAAKLLAVKICSSVSTSCSGVALIQGMDFAMDPNGDGSTSDAADIINMSLGSPYGPASDDDLSAASDNASAAGTVVVASAGNSGDKPYIVGSPSSAKSVISVAQTAVPSSTGFAMGLSRNGGPFVPTEAVAQSWSKPIAAEDAKTNVPVQFGDGAGGNVDGCLPFAAGTLAGKVVLVDRGTCNFSAKIANIAAGNGAIGVIGLITPGDPFDGSLGDCPNNLCAAIPGFMVSQATSTAMKAPTTRVTFDPEAGIALVGHMVGSSSRGPSNLGNLLKPDIGAPGASVSAVAGTGTGREPFGGTSGAAPMVSGAAALLQGAWPSRSPLEIKAVLMNTAETGIMNRPVEFGGYIAAITRIGGGEVRVDRAYHSPIAAWVASDLAGSLGFGFVEVTGTSQLTKTVTVKNYTGSAKTYDINPTFRYQGDVTNGAVTVAAPPSVLVPANGTATFDVTLTIDPSKLRPWTLDSGANGANPDVLTSLEYDGYVNLDLRGDTSDDADPAHLAWEVLPRSAAVVTLNDDGDQLDNAGQAADLELYTLVAQSAKDPETTTPGDNIADADFRSVGVATYQVPAGFCLDDESWLYAIDVSTWERQSHSAAPVLFEFDFDLDRDGTPDYAVYNRDLSGLSSLSDGRNVTFVQNLATGDETGWFTTDHKTNSANTALYFCAEQMGLTIDDLGTTKADVAGFAVDFYTSGETRDEVAFEANPYNERYYGIVDGDPFFSSIDAGASKPFEVFDAGASGTGADDQGVQIRVINGRGDTETIVVPASH